MEPGDAAVFKALSQGDASATQCMESLQILSQHLHRHHGEQVVILIDEYDTPLHEAFVRGYYDEAVTFFRGLLTTLERALSQPAADTRVGADVDELEEDLRNKAELSA